MFVEEIILKFKKKIVGSIENYDYYCMWLCTVVGAEKEKVTELSKQWQRRRKKDGRCVDRGLCRAHDWQQ